MDVKVFALSTCIHCRNAREYLDKMGVSYDCVEVDLLQGQQREDTLDEVRKFNPECSFPTIVIGDKVIVGFKKDDLKETLGL